MNTTPTNTISTNNTITLKKDKKKVLGEVFDDARIKTFLGYQAYGNTHHDYHLLEKAYRGMKAENFERFLYFFIESKHDINAKNNDGLTFLATIEQHTQAQDYIDGLKKYGGKG